MGIVNDGSGPLCAYFLFFTFTVLTVILNQINRRKYEIFYV